jgi:hypothetical protein
MVATGETRYRVYVCLLECVSKLVRIEVNRDARNSLGCVEIKVDLTKAEGGSHNNPFYIDLLDSTPVLPQYNQLENISFL